MDFHLIFRFLLLAGFILGAWKVGDRHNWRLHYYPTMLFAMLVNMLASYLSYHQLLWVFSADGLIRTHTVLNLLNTFTILPLTAWLFLSKYPRQGPFNQIVYHLIWIIGYTIIEAIDQQNGGITYQHGWSLGWSALLNCTMFPIFAVHRNHPVKAWAITVLVAWLILVHFNFLTAEMR